jgi:hypothetical protein
VYDGDNKPFIFTETLPEFPEPVEADIELIGPRELKVNEGSFILFLLFSDI